MKNLKDYIVSEDTKMLSLNNYILESNWSDNVEQKWHPEPGLFTKDDPSYIAHYLLRHSDDEAQAMSRLVFYMNRAGDRLENVTVLKKAKKILKSLKK